MNYYNRCWWQTAIQSSLCEMLGQDFQYLNAWRTLSFQQSTFTNWFVVCGGGFRRCIRIHVKATVTNGHLTHTALLTHSPCEPHRSPDAEFISVSNFNSQLDQRSEPSLVPSIFLLYFTLFCCGRMITFFSAIQDVEECWKYSI